MEHYKNLDLTDIKYVCEQTGQILTEQWKDIPDYEGIYKCSDLGRVKSLFRKYSNGINRYHPEKIMSQFLSKHKYLIFGLKKNGERKNVYGHALVALCFMNFKFKRGVKLVIDHRNNVKHDNRASNLQIITYRSNTSKSQKTSTGVVGVKKNKNKYQADFKIGGNLYNLGFFENIEDAKRIRNQAVTLAENGNDFSHLVKSLKNKNKFRGVAKTGNKYVGKIYRDGKMYYLGTYDTAEEAHIAYINEKSKK